MSSGGGGRAGGGAPLERIRRDLHRIRVAGFGSVRVCVDWERSSEALRIVDRNGRLIAAQEYGAALGISFDLTLETSHQDAVKKSAAGYDVIPTRTPCGACSSAGSRTPRWDQLDPHRAPGRPAPRRVDPVRRWLAVVLATALALLVGARSARAGGDAWPFEVLSIESCGDACRLVVLRPTGESSPFAGCARVQVNAQYRWPWWRWADVPMTEAEHWQAIGFVEHARLAHTPVMVGSMGQGFDRLAGDRCAAASRGLRIIDGAVFSFAKWP